MLDKLIDFLIQCLELFKFWVVIDPYEASVVLRLGKYLKTIEAGFHWIIPFGVDKCPALHIVPSTHSLGNESVTTKDGKSVGFHAVVTYRVHDIIKATLNVEDVDHAVRDAVAGEIGRVLRSKLWSELADDATYTEITAACRRRGFRYGIEVMDVQFAGLALCKNIRLMSN
jgi:regulator of protease activity HflC (stomatin/prohibitin superfamily)